MLKDIGRKDIVEDLRCKLPAGMTGEYRTWQPIRTQLTYTVLIFFGFVFLTYISTGPLSDGSGLVRNIDSITKRTLTRHLSSKNKSK
jgi:hypothetical protein